jgi:anti-anti-sigma regulatory factor
MLSPLLIASTDASRRLLVMTVEGPVVDPAHIEPLRLVLPAIPVGHSLIVDVTEATEFSGAAIETLRSIAVDAAASGHTMIVVCGQLERRADLVLANLDTLVPVVAAIEDAVPLARAAA